MGIETNITHLPLTLYYGLSPYRTYSISICILLDKLTVKITIFKETIKPATSYVAPIWSGATKSIFLKLEQNTALSHMLKRWNINDLLPSTR